MFWKFELFSLFRIRSSLVLFRAIWAKVILPISVQLIQLTQKKSFGHMRSPSSWMENTIPLRSSRRILPPTKRQRSKPTWSFDLRNCNSLTSCTKLFSSARWYTAAFIIEHTNAREPESESLFTQEGRNVGQKFASPLNFAAESSRSKRGMKCTTMRYRSMCGNTCQRTVGWPEMKKRRPLVCAFMSDILDGRSPENIVYCKEEQQRQWLADVMGTEKFTVCPKKGAERRPADALTTGRPDEVITPADATSFRVFLSTGTSRRISNILNKVWVLCWFSIKIQQKSSNGWL